MSWLVRPSFGALISAAGRFLLLTVDYSHLLPCFKHVVTHLRLSSVRL